eukprot:308601_1
MASANESKQAEQKEQRLTDTKESRQLDSNRKILQSQGTNPKIKQQKEEVEKISLCFKITKFVIITGPGILVILAVGAIIFYVLDMAFAIFDFDLSEYTYWIITILCVANFLMSICGCCGTYKLSQIENEYKRLDDATLAFEAYNEQFRKDNIQLKEHFQRIEYRIKRMDNENTETITVARELVQLEPDAKYARKNHAEEWVEFKQLMNLWKIYETLEAIVQMKKIVKAYYRYAEKEQGGLNQNGYHDLVRFIVPKTDKHLFPGFHEVWWNKSDKNDNIYFDDFERVV